MFIKYIQHLLGISLTLFVVGHLCGQPTTPNPIHTSIPSSGFIFTPSDIQMSPAERERILRELTRSLQMANIFAQDASEPSLFDRALDFTGGVISNVVDKGIDLLPYTGASGIIVSSVLGEAKDQVADWLSSDDQDDYLRQRDFAFRQEIEKAMTAGIAGCTGDLNCIDQFANAIINDPDLQSQFQSASDLGIYDHAHTRALIKSAKDQAVAQYTGTFVKIDNLDLKVTNLMADMKATMVNNFQQINNNQRTLIKGVATLIDIEQRQIIGLQNIQTTLNQNFAQIGVGIQNITQLQQINLFLSAATLEAVGIIDQKVDVVNQKIDIVSTQINGLTATVQTMHVEQRNARIQDIFLNSPLNLKIKELTDINSNISQLLLKQEGGEKKRQEILANLQALKVKEDVIIASKMISTWGNVAKEALSIFCQNCPEELSKGISAVVVTSNIVGNLASGNIAGAVMNALSIFKKPEPSPELRMLQQISQQLTQLERSMNQQFQQVHQHLFALEQNLGSRMQIIDLKIDQLTDFVVAAHIQTMEQLSGINSKLNYVINQNECTKDLILTLTQQGGQDLCKVPVAEFKRRVTSGQINSFQDLDNFFRGNFCQPCVQALFKASNVSLADNATFRYAQCAAEGVEPKARPDRAYEFIFQNFIAQNARDTAFVNSLLLIPANVRLAPFFADTVGKLLQKSVVQLNTEDRNLRNHRVVMAYADYLLTMFTMSEFFDENRLLTPAEIRQNPGFSRERARKMILTLESARDLINHAMLQQSVLSGNGMFAKLDQIIKSGASAVPTLEDANFNLLNAFVYNPYLSKNYGAYLVDKHIGLDRLKSIIENNALKKGKQRFLFRGFNIHLFEDRNNTPSFVINLTNTADPNRHVAFLQGFLPVADGKIDETLYQRNMEFAFPAAYLELQSMRDRIVAKLGEMNLIVSPALDAPNAPLSRENLQQIIVAHRN